MQTGHAQTQEKDIQKLPLQSVPSQKTEGQYRRNHQHLQKQTHPLVYHLSPQEEKEL